MEILEALALLSVLLLYEMVGLEMVCLKPYLSVKVCHSCEL